MYKKTVPDLSENEILIRMAANEHFLEHGDKIKQKKNKTDAHAVYDVLRGYLTKYAFRRVGKSWMDAEDVVQDAYVKVLETAKMNEFFNFGGLYKIWLDRSISAKLRDKSKLAEIVFEDQVMDEEGLTTIELAEGEWAPPELLIDVQNRVNEIMDRSNAMKPKTKAIVRLVVLFGYTYREVANMMEISVKRVENTLVHFRRKLRDEQANDDNVQPNP